MSALPINRNSSVKLVQPVLPTLRQDLNLFVAPADEHGRPTWHLHDPAANEFYRIGWPAFELLSRWHLRSPSALLAAVNRETTLTVGAAELDGILQFLATHHLLECASTEDSARLAIALRGKRKHWALWLLKNYLFFRVPLLRPEPLLDAVLPRVRWLMTRRAWAAVAGAAVMVLLLLARQWDAFRHSFKAYTTLSGVICFGVALVFAKVIHELGHGLTSRAQGCRVPAMGVAFLVMWPVLYTDTNEAWKLPSRAGRLRIAVAGMAAELLLALAATVAWLVLSDGPIRAAAFFLATTTWVTTLAINASPFMRFDGYFLLSDLVGMPNLATRSFAMGRWWLREKFFELGDPAPEYQRPAMSRFMILYAYATWTYRAVLFIGIALLVYHYFFKALGLFLMAIEVGWFIARPVWSEVSYWWERRNDMRWTFRTGINAAVLALIVLAFVVPWHAEVSAPAVVASAMEQSIYAPVPAQIIGEPARGVRHVKAGDLLLKLQAPDLDARVAIAAREEANLRRQLDRQNFADPLLQQGEALRHYWEESAARLAGLRQEQARLTVRAPFDGDIVVRSDELSPGSWVTPRDLLYVVADMRHTRVEAYVEESDLDRLISSGGGRFVPETPGVPSRDCHTAELVRLNASELEEPMLASTFGGAIPTAADRHGVPLVVRPIFRVRLSNCTPDDAPQFRMRGTAQLRAEPRSFVRTLIDQIVRVASREGGL